MDGAPNECSSKSLGNSSALYFCVCQIKLAIAMTCSLSVHDLERIAAVIGGTLLKEEHSWIIEQRHHHGRLEQLITIYPQVSTPRGEMTLVTVQSRQGYYQLFGCTDFLIIEPDEVVFVARANDAASCLLIGAERTCTLYAGVPLRLLRQPLDRLDPALLLAVMQLSLAEHLFVGEHNG